MSDDPISQRGSGVAARQTDNGAEGEPTLTDPCAPEGQAPAEAAAPRTDGRVFVTGELVGELYELREELGSGGMGQVFEAYDRVLERRVAIKVGVDRARSPWDACGSRLNPAKKKETEG